MRGVAVFRSLFIAPCLLCLLAQLAVAQEWANKMFQTRVHDYGTVARAAKTEYVFELQNLYKETVHIAAVRASCGCAMPRIVKDTLGTWEKGGVLVELNTRAFQGQRKATITVTIDKPFYAEVQLTITGFIRTDVVLDPGTINFDSVDQGEGAVRTVNVNYAGRSDWQILDVRSANTNLIVEPVETQRANGRVGYQLKVQLKSDAPSGSFSDQMILVTNDAQSQNIPVRVEGNIVSPLTVSPATLSLGVLRPGQVVTRNLVVRGKAPFHVTGVECEHDGFQFRSNGDSKELHLVPITFTAGSEPGKVAAEVLIQTDMGGSASGRCLVTAEVQGEAVAEVTDSQSPTNTAGVSAESDAGADAAIGSGVQE